MNNIRVPIPKGKIMIIGGAENKETEQEHKNISEAILKKFVSFCGNKARIVLITSASEEYALEKSQSIC